MVLIIYIILFAILISILWITYVKTSKTEGFTSYSKCNTYRNNKILESILNKYNITKVDEDSDFYIPCGYTTLEKQLKSLILNKKSKIFGIAGCDLLVGKNHLWSTFIEKFGRNIAKRYLPESYILNDPSDLSKLSTSYKKNAIYLLKKNIQRKEGIKLTRDLDEILSGFRDNYVIAQKYIQDLYLIKNRKVNLRMYLLIICDKGVVSWYFSNIGKCMYTNKDMNTDYDLDPETHLTSLNLDPSIYNTNPLSLDELKNFVGEHNYRILFNRIITIVQKCKICFEGKICQNKKINEHISFQLFGLDFIFTNNFQPYLLEMNKGPQMSYINSKDYKIKEKIYTDLLSKVGIIKNNPDNKNSFMYIH